MSSFAVQKIVLQRKEKIDYLYKILYKTIDSQKSILSQIKDQEKELQYFKNMEIVN